MSFGRNSKNAIAPTSESETVESRVQRLFVSSVDQARQTHEKIKIGVEIEFFIERLDNQPVNLIDARNFMITVANQHGWNQFIEPGYEDVVSKVSFEVPSVGYHSLKFEHPPHMLEVALAPYDDLNLLNDALKEVWKTFELAAAVTSLRLIFSPSISPPKIDWKEINQFSSRYRALAATREKAVTEMLRNESWVHFTTYTAATQFHIGGHHWWKDGDDLVKNLYRVELFASRNAYDLLKITNENVKDSFQQRWGSYFKVFGSLNLLGFPKIEDWSVKAWIYEFCRSSLVLVQEDPFFGKNLADIADVITDGELARAIQSVRDLQIVKPKLFGTLEFRADPALPDPNAILKQAAFRFGLYHHILKYGISELSHLSYEELAERWRAGVNVEGLEHIQALLKKFAYRALESRGLNEEKLL